MYSYLYTSMFLSPSLSFCLSLSLYIYIYEPTNLMGDLKICLNRRYTTTVLFNFLVLTLVYKQKCKMIHFEQSPPDGDCYRRAIK